MTDSCYADRGYKLNQHCSYCGKPHRNETYPKTCSWCGHDTYLNAPSVGISLISINSKLLIIRRAISPCIGEWALPGGYKELSETWQEGVAREVNEETGITVDPSLISLAGVENAGNGSVLVFGRSSNIILPEPIEFKLDKETMEAKLIDAPVPLCFPHHQTMMEAWFRNSL